MTAIIDCVLIPEEDASGLNDSDKLSIRSMFERKGKLLNQTFYSILSDEYLGLLKYFNAVPNDS